MTIAMAEYRERADLAARRQAGVIAAIAKLVGYSWRDEEDDYVDNCSDGPDGNQRGGHIFESLMRVQAWLEAEHGYPRVEPRPIPEGEQCR